MNRLAVAGLFILSVSFNAAADGEHAGASLSKPCLSCHDVETFAGQDAAALVAAMEAIKAGEFAHMPFPASLTEEKIAAIAAYLAGAANPSE